MEKFQNLLYLQRDVMLNSVFINKTWKGFIIWKLLRKILKTKTFAGRFGYFHTI